MRLFTKLVALRNATNAVIEELREDGGVEEEIEAEILLTRSAKNRRSDKNTVMTMTPLNGAPAVPESWMSRRAGGAGPKNRQVLAKILADYEPMTRREAWVASRKIDARLKDGMEQKNFQQMVNRMVRHGKLRLKNDNLVMGV